MVAHQEWFAGLLSPAFSWICIRNVSFTCSKALFVDIMLHSGAYYALYACSHCTSKHNRQACVQQYVAYQSTLQAFMSIIGPYSHIIHTNLCYKAHLECFAHQYPCNAVSYGGIWLGLHLFWRGGWSFSYECFTHIYKCLASSHISCVALIYECCPSVHNI